MAQSTISLHGAINSTTWSRFTVGLLNEWGTLCGCRIQLKLALFFSPDCSDGLPIGLSFFFGMGGIGGQYGEEVMAS